MPTRSPAERDALLDAFQAFVEVFVHIAAGPLADRLSERLAAKAPATPARSPVGLAQASPPFLTQREAAAYTGRSVSSLRRARSVGLPFARVGGNVMFERAVLDSFMRGEQFVGNSEPEQEIAQQRVGLARGPPTKSVADFPDGLPLYAEIHIRGRSVLNRFLYQ